MTTLTLRDVPEELHSWLKQQARAHHRSLNKEAIALLEDLRGQVPLPVHKATVDEIMRIAERVARAPVMDARTAEEIIGYDEDGLPR